MKQVVKDIGIIQGLRQQPLGGGTIILLALEAK